MGPRNAAYGDQQGPPDVAVQRLASEQHGVVAQSQLIALGLTPQAIYRRRLRGNLIGLHRGVYAVGHIALTARSRELAAVLACGPEAILSHRSAAALWGLRRTSSPRIEVTAPRGRKPRDGIVVHRSRVLEEEDRALIDAIPTTSVARTLVDLADVLPPSSLEKAVNEAELLALFDLDALERTLVRVSPRRGRTRLARALQAYQSQRQFTRIAGERRYCARAASTACPVRTSTYGSRATRSTCTGPTLALQSNWTVARFMERHGLFTMTAGGIAPWRLAVSRSQE